MTSLLPTLLSLVLQAPAPPSTPVALRSVDWANRNYGRYLRLHNGRFAMRRYPSRRSPLWHRCRHTTQAANLVEVHYADMTGDSVPEAIVDILTYRNMCTGARWKRRVLIIFKVRAGHVVELDRIAPLTVQRLKIASGTIHVKRLENRRGKIVQCRDAWRLQRGKLRLTRTRCTPVPTP